MLLGIFLFHILASIQPALTATPACSSPNLARLLADRHPGAVNTIEREWARAYANRDTSSLGCIFADEFQITSPGDKDFQVHYKSDVLQWLAGREGSAELEGLQVKSHKSAAAARGSYAVRRDGKLISRYRFIDFFVYRDGRWQAMVRTLTESSLN